MVVRPSPGAFSRAARLYYYQKEERSMARAGRRGGAGGGAVRGGVDAVQIQLRPWREHYYRSGEC